MTKWFTVKVCEIKNELSVITRDGLVARELLEADAFVAVEVILGERELCGDHLVVRIADELVLGHVLKNKFIENTLEVL